MLGLEKIDERELLELVQSRSRAAPSTAADGIAGETVRVQLAAVRPIQPEPVYDIYEDPKGDLVVVSADGRRALVKRQKLVSVCHYFRTLLAQPDTVDTETDDGLPALRIQESAAVLKTFFYAVFSPPPPPPADAGDPVL